MCKSWAFSVVLTIAATFGSALGPGDGENWHVDWFDTVANKVAKYEAVNRGDAEIFIKTHLQGVNLATSGPACEKIRLLKTKDGVTQQIDTFSVADVKAALDRINKPIDPAHAADKVKALGKEGWLKALAQSEHKLGESLRACGQKLKNAARDISDIRRAVQDETAEIGEKELKQINDVIANYNRVATEIRAGSLSASFSDLQLMKPLSESAKKTSPRLARERLSTVHTKLEEIGLRLEQRELADSRDQLHAEFERLSRDKEAGLNVRRQEQDLESAFSTWKSKRDDLQRRIEIHSERVDEVFSARQAMQDLPEKNLQAPPSEPK